MFRLMLVLSSDKREPERPMFGNSKGMTSVSGSHVYGRSRGSFFLDYNDDTSTREVYVPQRNKGLTFYGNPRDLDHNVPLLEVLDAQFPGLTQLQKYEKIYQLLSLRQPMMLETSGTHGAFSFFSSPDRGLYRYGMVTDHSTVLYISTEDIPPSMHYHYYRFAPLSPGRPLFISTQGICSKWWRWHTTFGDNLKSFNAFESWMRNH